jgi:serine/threonine-protein kinase
MALTPGEIIEGKYRIVRMIGEGGMGAVYEGENVRIQRRVAIKVLHAGVAENAETVLRFEREAQAAGRIGNDHILEVLDLGTLDGGDRYMVMEFLDGESLSGRIERLGRLTPSQALPLLQQLLDGLGAAHGAGIVHRDLKPDNVFILKQKAGVKDYVKVIDFGISRFQPLTDDGMRMTRTGTVMGTPYYMSPEQANGSREADARSDLYAVGVILYEAVTGNVPYQAPTLNQLLFKIVLEEPIPPEQFVSDLDPAFSTIIKKSMARKMEHRFQTAAEFRQALDEWATTGAQVGVIAEGAASAHLLEAAGLTSPNSIDQSLGGTTPAVSTPGVRTVNTWAQSQHDALPDARKKKLLIASMAGALAVAAIAGAVAFMSHEPAPVATASSSTSVVAAAPLPSPPAMPPVSPAALAAPAAPVTSSNATVPSASASTAPAKSVAPVSKSAQAGKRAPGTKQPGDKPRAAAYAADDFGY